MAATKVDRKRFFNCTESPEHGNWKKTLAKSYSAPSFCSEDQIQEEQTTLIAILDKIISDKLKAGTPILTNVITRKNMIYIKAEKVKLLQQFAEHKNIKGNKELAALKVRPVNLKVPKKQTGAGCGQAVKHDQRDVFINCVVVVKVFLNGTGDQTDKSVSVCVSVVNRDGDRQKVQEGQKLVVSIYLKDPNKKEVYRRDFKMDFSPALEKMEKGLFSFISKEEFGKYVKNGAAQFGVSITFGSG